MGCTGRPCTCGDPFSLRCVAWPGAHFDPLLVLVAQQLLLVLVASNPVLSVRIGSLEPLYKPGRNLRELKLGTLWCVAGLGSCCVGIRWAIT